MVSDFICPYVDCCRNFSEMAPSKLATRESDFISGD